MEVLVNNKKYIVPDGVNIVIINDTLYVNGLPYDGPEDSRHYNITVDGGVINLSVQKGDVTVKGNVGKVDAGGSVIVEGNVSEGIDAGGSVTCGHVTGDVDAGGSINCGNVTGDVDAGGSVHHK